MEVIPAHIDRIEELNPRSNFYQKSLGPRNWPRTTIQGLHTKVQRGRDSSTPPNMFPTTMAKMKPFWLPFPVLRYPGSLLALMTPVRDTAFCGMNPINNTSLLKASLPCSIFSPEGAAWVTSKATPGTLNSPHDPPVDLPPDEDVFADAHNSSVFIKLPPKSVAHNVFRTYFRSLSYFCTLFDEQEFMSRFAHEYPANLERSPSWWACTNAVLALGYMLDPDSYSTAWLFWKNASLSLSSFLTGPPRLHSAQALLAMVCPQQPIFSLS